MIQEDFNEVVERRIELIRSVLTSKGKEYARGDRLSNFKNGAAILHCSPERTAIGYMTKQLVSVMDYIHDTEAGMIRSQAEWDEKLGDCINYLILLEAITTERRANGSVIV